MNKPFRRILDLVRRTGDRMVVTDPEGEDVFVVMDLDQYEAMLTSAPATPRKTPGTPVAQETPTDLWEAMPPATETAETWDVAKLSEPERADLEKQYQAYLAHKKEHKEEGQVPVVVEPKEAEPKAKASEEFGEEQFYLEPIE